MAAITSAMGGGAWGEGSAGGLHFLQQLQAIQQAAQGAGPPLAQQQAALLGGAALPPADATGSFLDQLQANAHPPVRPQVLRHGLAAGRPIDEQTRLALVHPSQRLFRPAVWQCAPAGMPGKVHCLKSSSFR